MERVNPCYYVLLYAYIEQQLLMANTNQPKFLYKLLVPSARALHRKLFNIHAELFVKSLSCSRKVSGIFRWQLLEKWLKSIYKYKKSK